MYYRSTINARSYDVYVGTAFPDPRNLDTEPHRTEAQGLYFDGNDFIAMNTIKDTFTSTSQVHTFDT
jgi:hypothetical protein